MPVYRRKNCKLSGVPLTRENCTICYFLCDSVARQLRPYCPWMRYLDEQKRQEGWFMMHMYNLYKLGALPEPYQSQWAEANRALEEREELERQLEMPPAWRGESYRQY